MFLDNPKRPVLKGSCVVGVKGVCFASNLVATVSIFVNSTLSELKRIATSQPIERYSTSSVLSPD